MKKVILMSFIIMMTIGLTGCGGIKNTPSDDVVKTTKTKVNSTEEKINVNNGKKGKSPNSLQYSQSLLKYSLLVRECFEKAPDKEAAINCHREAAELLIKFELEYDNKFVLEKAQKHVGDWSDVKKADVLNKLDNEIELIKTNVKFLKAKVK